MDVVSHTCYFVRKALRLVASNSETPLDHLSNKVTDTIDVAYLVLRLLPSKDGVAIRRLLMTAVSSYKLFYLIVCLLSLYPVHQVAQASGEFIVKNILSCQRKHFTMTIFIIPSLALLV